MRVPCMIAYGRGGNRGSGGYGWNKDKKQFFNLIPLSFAIRVRSSFTSYILELIRVLTYSRIYGVNELRL